MSDSISGLTLERGIQWACSHLEQHISPASNLTSRLRWTCRNEATEPQGKDSDFFIWEEFEYLLLDWALRPSYHWFNPWLVSISLSCFLFVALQYYQHFEPEPTSYNKIESSDSFSHPLLSLFNFNSGTIWKLKEILHCNEVSSI